VLQFEGGQSNPTFHVADGGGACTCWQEAARQAAAVGAPGDREYRVIKALADHTMSPYKAYALCRDDSVIGTTSTSGSSCRPHPGRSEDAGHFTADRGRIFDSMNDVLRASTMSITAPSAGHYGREGQYIQRQLARWSSQYDLAAPSTSERWRR